MSFKPGTTCRGYAEVGTREGLLTRWLLKTCSQSLRMESGVIRVGILRGESEDGWEGGRWWGGREGLGSRGGAG